MSHTARRLLWLCAWIVSIAVAIAVYHVVTTGVWRPVTEKLRVLLTRPNPAPTSAPATAVPASVPKPARRSPLPPGTATLTQTVYMANGPDLVRNGSFSRGLANWDPWQYAKTVSGLVCLVHVRDGFAARIASPEGKLAGLIQNVQLVSGTVYRLRARGRAADHRPGAAFGGRIALNCPPQPEIQMLWPGYDSTWVEREIVFTNRVTGTGSVFTHLGYGNAVATGEFTELHLQSVTITQRISHTAPCFLPRPQDTSGLPSNVVWRVRHGVTTEFASLLAAIEDAQSHDTILVNPGVYHEENRGGEWLASLLDGLHIVGRGMPIIMLDASNALYQISMQMPYNKDLLIENLCLATRVSASRNDRVCGLVVTSCNGVILSNCILYAEVHSTNTEFQALVAVNNATSIRMVGGAIISDDCSGSNRVFHASTHNAQPPRFERVLFGGRGVDKVVNGEARFVDCYVLGDTDRPYYGLKELPADLGYPEVIERVRAACAWHTE